MNVTLRTVLIDILSLNTLTSHIIDIPALTIVVTQTQVTRHIVSQTLRSKHHRHTVVSEYTVVLRLRDLKQTCRRLDAHLVLILLTRGEEVTQLTIVTLRRDRVARNQGNQLRIKTNSLSNREERTRRATPLGCTRLPHDTLRNGGWVSTVFTITLVNVVIVLLGSIQIQSLIILMERSLPEFQVTTYDAQGEEHQTRFHATDITIARIFRVIANGQ